MKILMINSYNYLLGGIERVVFETSKLLEAKGHEVVPFAMNDPRNQHSLYSNFFVKQRDISQVKLNYEGLVTACKMIYNSEARVNIGKLIDEIKPDIAHVHHIYGRLTPSILYELKQKQIPVVMTIHDYKLACPNYLLFNKASVCEKCQVGKYYHAILNKCVKESMAASAVYAIESYLYKMDGTYDKCVSAFVAPSAFMKNKMIEYGYNESKIHHIYNFLDIKDYLDCYRKDNYLLYFGRLSSEKGLYTLLDAMEMNRDKKLVVVGTGNLENDLKVIVSNKGLNVEFLGFKSGTELKKLVSRARVVMVPSIWYENNPMVVIESFALGTPVIGADIGGIPELITDGITGLLFKNGDSVDLAEKIMKIFNMSTHSLEEMGRMARKYAEAHFNSQTHYNSLYNLYQKLVKS